MKKTNYEIPKVALGRFLSDRPRNGYSPVEVDEWTGMQALGLGCLSPDGFRPVQLKNVPAKDARNRGAILSDGDLLISRANTRELVGLSGVYRDVGGPCVYPDLMMRLVPNRRIIPEFLDPLLRSQEVRRQIMAMAQGTSESMVKINGSIVMGLQVRVPGLDEQRKIVEVLNTIDAQIDESYRQIEKLNKFHIGLTEYLISDPLGPCGGVPYVPLGRYLAGLPKNGYSPVAVDGWTGVSSLGLGCLTSTGFSPVQIKSVPSGDARNRSAVLSDGDLLVSRANTRDLVGLSGVYRDIGSTCIYPDLMMRVQPGPRILAKFLDVLLRGGEARKQIKALAQGTSESMVKITGVVLQSLRVRVPDVEVQQQVLSRLGIWQGMVDALENEKRRLLRIREGLAEDLLSGRTRA